jgi:amino acid transporter
MMRRISRPSLGERDGSPTSYPLRRHGQHLDETSGSPRTALVVQGVIALGLVAFGAVKNAGFKGLVEYSLPVFWGFFMLVGVALFVLRVKEPNVPRPFKVPGYPVTPAVFVLMCGWLFWSSLIYHRANALVGIGVLAVGAVVLSSHARGLQPGCYEKGSTPRRGLIALARAYDRVKPTC